MATATAPTQDRAGDQVAGILAVLDAAKKLEGYKTITLFAEHYEEGIAEHAMRLWASANSCRLEDVTNEYPESGYSIRSLETHFDPNRIMQGHVRLQWRSVPLAQPAAAPIAPEATEPAPSNVIPLPVAPAAEPNVLPLSNADERRVLADTDDTSTRFSLLELD